jgi:hypothetical protein
MNKTTKTIMKRTKKTKVDDDTFTVDIKELRTELNKIAEKYFTPVPVAPVEEVVVDELENNYGQPENQTNLLVQIAEITGDESLLAAQYPVTEEEAFQLSDNHLNLRQSNVLTFQLPPFLFRQK